MPVYSGTLMRVATECLNRFDMHSEISSAAQQVIRAMENQRFWFNETATTLTCSVSVETVAVPTNFLSIQYLQVTQNSANIALVPVPFDMIRFLNINNTLGLPTRYCQFGPYFHLANIPDSAYPIPCYYIKKLPALSAATDTNDWLSAAEDVVVYGAASIVSAMLGDITSAAKFSQLKSMFYQERLIKLRDTQRDTRIKPTTF